MIAGIVPRFLSPSMKKTLKKFTTALKPSPGEGPLRTQLKKVFTRKDAQEGAEKQAGSDDLGPQSPAGGPGAAHGLGFKPAQAERSATQQQQAQTQQPQMKQQRFDNPVSQQQHRAGQEAGVWANITLPQQKSPDAGSGEDKDAPGAAARAGDSQTTNASTVTNSTTNSSPPGPVAGLRAASGSDAPCGPAAAAAATSAPQTPPGHRKEAHAPLGKEDGQAGGGSSASCSGPAPGAAPAAPLPWRPAGFALLALLLLFVVPSLTSMAMAWYFAKAPPDDCGGSGGQPPIQAQPQPITSIQLPAPDDNELRWL